jgi:hypothetical protein
LSASNSSVHDLSIFRSTVCAIMSSFVGEDMMPKRLAIYNCSTRACLTDLVVLV